MTTQELREEVLAYGFNSPRYGARVEKWLDEAHKKIARRINIRTRTDTESISTTSGVSTYALPSDFGRIISISDTDLNDPIESLDMRTFDDLTVESGQPYFYTIIQGNINLYPTPNGTYNLQLRYYTLPTTLSSSGTVVDPVTPEDYDNILVDYALSKAYAAEHDYKAADYHRNLFIDSLANMKGELQSDTHEGPKQVPGTWAEF